jgi:hypothetical protein
MFISKLMGRLTGFARKEDGTIALEAMIVLPAMFWAFLVCFSIFDTFRMYSINQKAAFTIGDAISRETAPLDGAYLEGARQMFEYLSASEGRSSIRVSSLRWDGADERFYSDWSHISGNVNPLTDGEVSGMNDRLPVMPNNERIVLVETWSDYDPPFRTGIEEQNIRNFVFTRPRFAPRVCWEECD